MHKLSERTLAQLVLIGMIVQLLVIGYTFYSSYQGRVDSVNHAREACKLRNELAPNGAINCQKAYPKASLFP